jgi:hypothetical protein
MSFFVLGAALLEKELVKCCTTRGAQFLFQQLPGRTHVSTRSRSPLGIAQVRADLLSHRKYGLISIRVILDQLICIHPNLARRGFSFRHLGDCYLAQIGLMYLRQVRRGVLLTRCRRDDAALITSGVA